MVFHMSISQFLVRRTEILNFKTKLNRSEYACSFNLTKLVIAAMGAKSFLLPWRILLRFLFSPIAFFL